MGIVGGKEGRYSLCCIHSLPRDRCARVVSDRASGRTSNRTEDSRICVAFSYASPSFFYCRTGDGTDDTWPEVTLQADLLRRERFSDGFDTPLCNKIGESTSCTNKPWTGLNVCL